MKKIMVFLIVAIWAFLGISYLREQRVVDDNMIVEAFNQPEFSNEESTISLNGEYTGKYLSAEGAKELLSQIATGLGIDDNVQITQEREENRGEITLSKQAKRAQTTLKFFTIEDNATDHTLNVKQYISAELKLLDTVDCALEYQKKLEEIFKDNQVSGEVTLSLKGKYPQKLNLEEKNKVANDLLEKLNTNIITEERNDNIYVIYGYSKFISNYKKVGNQKINVSLAMNYNEEEKTTNIYLSTPLINEDY